MSLAEKLDAIREGAKKMIPPEKFAVMHEETVKLRESGIMNGVIKVGARLPDFEMTGARGALVSSAALLAQGPLVLTVFRGHW